MFLRVYSDAVYITIPESRSCYAGTFYLSCWSSPRTVKPTPKIKGHIHTKCKTIRTMVSSEAEAETCGIFDNGKTGIGMRPNLIALDHKQPETPLKMENSATEGFLNSGMKPKRSKTWDMKWHWLIDKEFLDQIIVYWYRGTNNDNYCFKKLPTPIHHHQMQPRFIHTSTLVSKIPQTIRLCEGVLNQITCTHYYILYNSLKPI